LYTTASLNYISSAPPMKSPSSLVVFVWFHCWLPSYQSMVVLLAKSASMDDMFYNSSHLPVHRIYMGKSIDSWKVIIFSF
jgi:hypothetical protein